mgnify:CR=1 FL=1
MAEIDLNQRFPSPFGPRYLAQLAVWLCHADTKESGGVFEVGGGYIHRVRNALSRGLHLPGDQHSAENIAAGADVIDDLRDPIYPAVGESWTIGRETLGDDWSKQF